MMTSQYFTTQESKKDLKTKSKITSKISSLNKQRQFLDGNCHIDDAVKKQLHKEITDKKKKLTKKIKQRSTEENSKKAS